MNSRAVLINPPFRGTKVWVREGRCQQWDIWGAPFMPYSLAMISTQLIRLGFSTLLIDSGAHGKEIERVLDETEEFQPDIVFVSVASPTIESDLGWFAPQLKKRFPKIKLATLGVHVSRFPAEVLEKYLDLDFVVTGEPEITAGKLARAVVNGFSVDSLEGLAWRDRDGRARVNSRRKFTRDLDSLGFPDWKDLEISRYIMPLKGRPFSLIGFSRGCPFDCTYCTAQVYAGKILRKRSVESLVAEIDYNLSRGVSDFLFWTELMTLDEGHLDRFLEALLARGLEKRINWVCNSRVDSGNLELFRKMKRAGCWQIAFGFEFGDDQILEMVKKGGRATTAQGRRTAERAGKAGLVLDGHFILGYPGETTGTMQKTIDYACSLPLTFAHFYAATPFPGSTLYEEALKSGWLEELEPEKVNQDKCCLHTENLDAETVNSFIHKAYRSFYLRPQTAWRGLMIPSSPREFLNLATFGWKFYSALRSDNPGS